jgi:hypothetical protein
LLWDDLNVLKQKLYVKSKTIEDYQYYCSCHTGKMNQGLQLEICTKKAGPFLIII